MWSTWPAAGATERRSWLAVRAGSRVDTQTRRLTSTPASSPPAPGSASCATRSRATRSAATRSSSSRRSSVQDPERCCAASRGWRARSTSRPPTCSLAPAGEQVGQPWHVGSTAPRSSGRCARNASSRASELLGLFPRAQAARARARAKGGLEPSARRARDHARSTTASPEQSPHGTSRCARTASSALSTS